ncbi:hypothetical protein AUJ30_01390 [Candidatus Wolfebacteria bacterium CG1_02_39_135]|uniref:Endolytic murein transglycosylase n=4 Tax=Candidatus Wolfeibacteriota TaxID=1752735 RepID=A0A2M7Q630_9BACT|nr:endolytic transglycosylase MltG [Parcubacteria group bacterium]OIO65158.1 MAG: hypothetical protein AUJ30_01390 [Candidatus Wolfebacteria bacterium CG1_02_39_135]PIU98777.1 MAG: endolytic transglycosylase MltG [Candidatus Wolfebacteria bacterium CG03_land_8_20_14_0_80_39_317]PIY58896.1 MAG: endolytic transglycosylase MltG [Candidatus Wolfebacteria bacterium CG_4_10_14_0_8_um_filter_39_64]PJB84153.1 MAG: endolytic transglycosylase MltG [Candidatus Wolfebacteria bacterium CG_4_9_14_0_8_um_filt
MGIKKGLLIVGCWLGVLGLSLLFLYLFQFLNFGSLAQNQDFWIKTGMSFNEIADQLKAENFIRSKIIFEIYSLLTGKANQFKPGRYILTTNISIPKLVKVLTKGPEEISVMIAPGMTLKEIDDKLSLLNIIKPNDLVNLDIHFLKNEYPWLGETKILEGFLLPDTYRFFSDSDTNLVIHKFLDNFEIKALPFFKGSDNILDKLILASLLEKEIPDYEEKKIAAGILFKRLKTGIPLQVDASLVYAKCSGRFFGCPPLTEADYKIDSSYNTYLYPGLTETPIANPGLESIKSVLNPEKTDYWYYLSDPKTKKTVFSKTLDEHNKNRAKYLY